jgi:threonine aldolase
MVLLAAIANAVASLGCTPAELSWKCGVDVLCLGGTKNGMLAGEAILFFDRSLSLEFAYRCKQAGQPVGKMRFLSAQWVGMLQERAWLRHAGSANKMAKQLEAELRSIAGVRIICPIEANAVFVEAQSEVLSAMRRRGWEFYTSIGTGGARFTCSWDTTESDIARLSVEPGGRIAQA